MYKISVIKYKINQVHKRVVFQFLKTKSKEHPLGFYLDKVGLYPTRQLSKHS